MHAILHSYWGVPKSTEHTAVKVGTSIKGVFFINDHSDSQKILLLFAILLVQWTNKAFDVQLSLWSNAL